MQCPGCNTRVSASQRACPNCGRSLRGGGPAAAKSAKSAKPGLRGLSDPADSASQVEELELSEPALETDANDSSASSGDYRPDPVAVQRMLGEDPELLETGLSLLADKKGKVIGLDYTTDVGVIDMLARDRGGSLVVVMVAKGDRGTDVVGEILQRIGWVRKHLAKVKEGVRGIVLMETPPGDLSYTAAAVADTVVFKTYRMTVSFEEIEV